MSLLALLAAISDITLEVRKFQQKCVYFQYSTMFQRVLDKFILFSSLLFSGVLECFAEFYIMFLDIL